MLALNTEGTKRVLKNTGYLAFGSIFSKGLLMIVFIYIARMIGPEQYGSYFTALEYVSLVSIFSKLGFDMTALREGAKNLDNVNEIQNKFLPIRFYFSIVVAIIGLILAILLKYDEIVLKLIITLLPLVIIGGAISSGLIEHFNTSFRIIENMRIVTFVQITRTIIFVVFSGLFIFAEYFNLFILCGIVLLSSIFTLAIQILYVKKYFICKINWKIDYSFIKKMIKPIILFGIVSVLYMVSMKIDIQMLNKLVNQEEVGYYAAGWQINNIGIVFISSLSLSLFPNSARLINKKAYRKKLGLFIIALSLIVSLIALVISLYSRNIVMLLFGERYDLTIDILKILVWFIPIRILLIWGTQVLESGNFLLTRVIVYLLPMFLNIVLNYHYIPQYGAIAAAYISIITSLFMLCLVSSSAVYLSKYRF